MVKTHVIRLQVIEGPNVHDQGVFCAFLTLLVEVQMNTGYTYMPRMHNNNLEIRIAAPLVARNKIYQQWVSKVADAYCNLA